MSLVRKYDKTLRRRAALRAVWLPGTEVRIGDIMLLKDGVLVSVGNLEDENIPYNVSSIGEAHSLSLQSKGVSQMLIQNGAKVSLSKLNTALDAELTISFQEENSYYLRTPSLSGVGMNMAMSIAREIAKLPDWDHSKNYLVHKIWRAEDFSFLGNMEGSSELTFKGNGEFIQNLISNGISSGLSKTGNKNMSLELMGKSGPVVMQVFRIKRNGDIF